MSIDMTRESAPHLLARRVHPPQPDDQGDHRDEREHRDGEEHHDAYCLRDGSKSPWGRSKPARSSRSLNRGRTPVARWKPRTRPSWSMPCCSKTKMSWEVMTSSSMPTTSV